MMHAFTIVILVFYFWLFHYQLSTILPDWIMHVHSTGNSAIADLFTDMTLSNKLDANLLVMIP